MAGYVITFRTGSTAVLPFASQTEIIGAFSADMVVAEMIVEYLWVIEGG
jgi:hypothetical protein